MRFTDDTCDIPDRLIALQEKGEVVFLCGAGISRHYGLPSFRELTEGIYERLGETWSGQPAEEDAMGVGLDGKENGPPALDRALFALSKRLRGSDTRSRIQADRLLTGAIEAKLQPPPGPFAVHADIWALSRDPESRQRIVTTNFDTLFESTVPLGTPSWSGPDLPPPLGTDFIGILHLHGRIADKELGLSRTSLVLNSAEFGEAYLRSGWAARYVYDLARATTIVMVGYGADDPPMRYILEVLAADRERYPDIREIFAFVACKPDTASRTRLASIWEAKGATAILYDSNDPADHDMLYHTISRWAEYARNPTGWRRTEAARILGSDPDDVSDSDWDRLKWLLGAGDASELLGDINPEPKWAAPLAKAEILSNEGVSPIRWIHKRLNDPGMPAAIAENVPVSQETREGIEQALLWRNRTSKDLHPVLLQAWRLILQVVTQRRSLGPSLGLRWARCMAALRDGDVSLATKRDILACLRPRIGIGHVFRWPELEPGPEESSLRLRHVLRVTWGPKSVGDIDELVTHLPADLRLDLIRSLVRQLDDALEEAADTDTLDAADSDVKSVSPHPQDEHSDGFYSIVRAIIDLWDVEVGSQPTEAKRVAQAWLLAPHLLLKRMGLHALRQSVFSSAEVVDALLALSDAEFWLSGARREIMQIFVHRWGEVDAKDRARVEERIVSGVPGSLLSDGPEDQAVIVRDYAVFMRLARIQGAGHALSDAAQQALSSLLTKYPEWRSGGERDDFNVWSSGAVWVGRRGDISALKGVQPDKLLERVKEVVDGDPIHQSDLWRLYCDAEPARALAALLASDPNSDKKLGAWQAFFWSITASNEQDIQQQTLDAVMRERFAFGPFTAISDWLLKKHEILAIETEQFLQLWDRLFEAVEDHGRLIEEQSRRDPTLSMLNSAEGKIGTILLNEFRRLVGDNDSSDHRCAILSRMEKLVTAEGQLGFLGVAALVDDLQLLYSEARDWVEQHLLPLTRWNSPFAPAAWSVLLNNSVPGPDLYRALKPGLIEAGSHTELEGSIEYVAGWLIAPLLWVQDATGPVPEIAAVDVRRALTKSVAAVRGSAAYWLSGAIDELAGSNAALWRQRIGPLFRQIWPLEPRCRSSEASLHLMRLALKTGDAFAEAVETIAPALGPLDAWDIESFLGYNEEAEPYYTSAPGALLTLLDAVVSAEVVPSGLLTMLERLAESEPALGSDQQYLKLLGWARRQASH